MCSSPSLPPFLLLSARAQITDSLPYSHLTASQHLGGASTWVSKAESTVYPSTKHPSQLLGNAGMEIGGLLNTRHAANADAQLRQQMHHSMQMSPDYTMNSHQSAPLGHNQSQRSALQDSGNLAFHHNMQQNSASNHMYQNIYETQQQDHDTGVDEDFGSSRSTKGDSIKAFACSTCSKGFARRSDLARHERIHSGVRPHACDFTGCGKKFIQRSALTVHQRVHTGVKPHTCERCSKPFSDSSSLARHRRIHSGKKPYTCPFANCQKTFTRRTTLTRHQHNHQLNSEQTPMDAGGTKVSVSETSSRNSTASPAERTLSPSPTSTELPPMTNMQRSGSDFGYLPHTSSLPLHMRNDFGSSNSPRSTPSMTTPSLTGYTSAPQSKPSPTSHPTNSAYGPPQPLEPPANGIASGSASPHLGALTWGSPGHGTLPSPGSLGNFDYPDPGFGGPHLYYPGSSIRRPQSTEPEDYGIRPRGSHALQLQQQQSMHAALNPNMNSNMNAHMNNSMASNMNSNVNSNMHSSINPNMSSSIGHVSMTADWSSMPVQMHDMSKERFVL